MASQLNQLFLYEEGLGRDAIIARGREVIRIEGEALAALGRSLDANFVTACKAIFRTRRQLVVTGMGKSGHIARKVAATFAATGTPAIFIHPAEAAHGDMGMLVQGDVLLVFSNSGNTPELLSLLHYARQLQVQIIGVASQSTSLLMELADIGICLPALREACTANIAPTTSTTLQLAMGDALTVAVMDMRGVSEKHLRSLHPGGRIGLRLTPVAEIMHDASCLPLVQEDTHIHDVICTMTSGCFGLAGVVDAAGDLVGVITDGDLRRHFDRQAVASARDVMTPSPKTIPSDMLATDVLLYLNDNKITSAFIVDRQDTAHPRRPIGIIHMHDLLRFGLN